MAGLCVGHGKAEVQHQADHFIIDVGFPAVARQKFEIEARETCNNIRMLSSNRFGVLPPAWRAANQQADLRIALFVKKVKKAFKAFPEGYLVGVGIVHCKMEPLPVEKKPGNFGSLSDAPLRGRGLMVLIADAHIRPAIYEERGRGKVAGEMKRRATVSALGVDQRRIGPR